MKRITILLAISLSVLLNGCAGYRAKAPQGFAAYAEGKEFRATSPDGVVYRVQDYDHEPKADLPFWKEALSKRMAEAGYLRIDSLELQVDGSQAIGFVYAAPLGDSDQNYLVVAIPGPKHLVVVEAAGESAKFMARREAILAAVKQIDLR